MSKISIDIQSNILNHNKTIFCMVGELKWIEDEIKHARENGKLNVHDIAEIAQKREVLKNDVQKLVKAIEELV